MLRGRLTPSGGSLLLVAALLVTACANQPPEQGDRSRAQQAESSPDGGGFEPLEPPEDFQRVDGVVDLSSLSSRPDTLAAWQQVVQDVQDVRIPSSVDDHEQRALWLEPSGEQDQPLLVVLHSWSTRYVQWFNSPYGQWADQQGWAMVAPDFRGAFRDPDATGSDLAVQDVVDSVDWALQRGGVDGDRVFVVGFSGGGMMSLLMAGRHPERFAGAVSWVPVHDLEDWYAYNVEQRGGGQYAQDIAASCGGSPPRDEDAARECEQRSPRTHLDAAREEGVPVFLGHGLSDRTVPPDHAVRAFDQLADEQDRLGEDVREAVAQGELPDDVPGEPAEDFFDDEDPQVHLARRSGPVTLVLFEGEHDMVFHPGLQFLAALAEREAG